MERENSIKMETLLSLPLRMCAASDFHGIVLKAAGCEGHLRARVRDQGAAEPPFASFKRGPSKVFRGILLMSSTEIQNIN